jgi:SAM-dependent methyltransferase
MRRRFDKAYYDRFYRNPRTRAVTPAGSRRQAAFAAAYLRHLGVGVRRILDIGCGTGATLRALGRVFAGAAVQGVELSDFLCRRYGWQQGSVADYRSDTSFDLVVCNDVLAYLDDGDCARAIGNLAELCRGALLLGVLTADDGAAYDPLRTDPQQRLRTAAWYRRRLSRHFVNVGGGLHLRRPTEVVTWALDQP